MPRFALTFSQKVMLGFGSSFLVLLLSSSVSIYSLETVIRYKDHVLDHPAQELLIAEKLNVLLLERVANMRGYLISQDERFLEQLAADREQFNTLLERMFASSKDADDRSQLEKIRNFSMQYRVSSNRSIAMLRDNKNLTEAVGILNNEVMPLFEKTKEQVQNFVRTQEQDLAEAKEQSMATSSTAINRMIGITIGGLLLIIAMVSTLSRSLRRQIESAVSVANSIASGQRNNVEFPTESQDEIGKLLQAMRHMLDAVIRAEDLTARQSRMQTSISEVYAKMRGELSPRQLAANVLNYLAEYMGAQVGAFYRVEGNQCSFLAGYAFHDHSKFPQTIPQEVGLVGQVAKTGKTITVDSVPEEYAPVSSSVGQARPRHLLVSPMTNSAGVVAVIELGAFNDFAEEQRDLLEAVKENIGLGLMVSVAKEKQQDLLEEARALTEELQAQQEELKAANEELEAQQEELKQSNEELEEQRTVLEEQKERLQQRNVELDQVRSEITDKAQALEQASKYKSEFLANMSHELRTPLNSILILSKSFSSNDDGNLNAEQLEFARTIYTAGVDLLNLINDILDLSKVEAGKMDIRVGEVDIAEVISTLNGLFRYQIETKGLVFKIEVANDIPVSIYTDQGRLEQILKNFLANALKFTEAGTVMLRFARPEKNVVLTRLTSDKVIAISVIDTGIGIPESKRSLIFEAFEQVDSTLRRKYGGTGLGLTIATELSKLLGGEIQVQSCEGQGSTFTVFIPEILESEDIVVARSKDASNKPQAQLHSLPQVTQPKIEPTPNRVGAHGIEDDRHNLKPNDKIVLVVEDDPKFAKILWRICKAQNFKCLLAENGEDGMEDAKRYGPSGVILDVRLPGMSGIAVLGMLKNNPKTRHIPVHIMSVEEKSQEALRMGAIGFLTKPTSTEEIERVLDKIGYYVSSERQRKVLVVEDRHVERQSIVKLIGDTRVQVVDVATAKEALEQLQTQTFDCMILDLVLPDMTGYELLRKVESEESITRPPVVIYTGKDISKEEMEGLRRFSESIIIKGVRSEERLLDEVSLFLHYVVTELPQEQQQMLERVRHREEIFEGKRLLIVDDDMRNVFALRSVLLKRGFEIIVGKDGVEALEKVRECPDIDVVLMDIMMPRMDGYEAIRQIRLEERFKDLPIIALTAKAMKADRERCLEVGANDYLPKPVDMESLLSLLRIWLTR